VLGLSPATLISLALSQEKASRSPIFVPALQQNFAISMYNYSRQFNNGPENPLTMGLKFQIAWQLG
jgi:hypothetical protein